MTTRPKLTPAQVAARRSQGGTLGGRNNKTKRAPFFGRGPVSLTPTPPKPAPARLEPKPLKTLLELRPHDCRWPIGDVGAKGFGFCGRRVKEGKSYCAEHYRRAHVQVRP